MSLRTVKRWSSGGRSLKRAHLRKDKSVSCSCQVTVDAMPEQSEVSSIGAKRRARTSAAMIGLALSMGATGVLLPRQDDGAAAAEPRVPDTAIAAALPVAQTGSSSGLQSSVLPTVKWVEHIVREGQTIRHVASHYQVSGLSVAIANGLTVDSPLRTGQVLRVPVSESASVQPAADESANLNVSVRPSPLVASTNLEQMPGLVGGGQVNRIEEEIDRDNALELLRQRRDKLRESLAELRYEESGLVASASKLEGDASQQESASDVSLTVQSASNPLEERVAVQSVSSAQSQGNPLPGIPFIAPDVTSPSTHQQSVAATLESQPEVAQPQVDQQLSVYRVNPGDTVAAIARAHNVPQSLLIEANRLSNPNVIFVGQVLSVPAAQPSAYSVVPETSGSFTLADASSTTASSAMPQTDVPQQYVAQAEESVLLPGATAPSPVAASSFSPSPTSTAQPSALELEATSVDAPSAESQTETEQVAVSPFSGSGVEPASEMTAPASQLRFSPSTSEAGTSSSANPYVASLLTEIRALRQRQQPNLSASSNVETAALASPTLPEAPTGGAVAVNPHMNQANEAAQDEDIRPVSTSLPAETPESQPELVAAAPLGSESYDPLLQPVTGRMVSPDLPPLPGADTFLPDAGGVFNGYIWPARGVLTSGYGWRWGRMHRGIDIASDVGTPIYSAATGVVEFAGWNSGGYGNMVEVRHPDGSMTRYAHMNAIHVRNGQNVSQGEQLGEMGSTGYSTGPHLHFEVHVPAQGTVNPLAYLPASR
jgi:murein DD-endopeptidase MepM/ murein hydrolase activator NlpD